MGLSGTQMHLNACVIMQLPAVCHLKHQRYDPLNGTVAEQEVPVGWVSSERKPRAAMPASTGTSSLRLTASAEQGLEGPAEWGRGSGSP